MARCGVPEARRARAEGVECRVGEVEGEKLDPTPRRLFFIFFFFYHAFIVFRYKKLRVALAMEKTKPINQNKTKHKKPTIKVHRYSGE